MSATKEKKEETPLMSQYNLLKGQHPDAILLFRVGDFYETFGSDAVRAAKALGIVLTRRANGAASHIELAGFPYHSLETYLPKLIRAGFRVAICEQLEDPKTTKTLVKRGITEMVSPGVTVSNGILDENSANYLSAIYFRGERAGVAFLDISTGDFKICEDRIENILKLISSFNPSEVLFSKTQSEIFQNLGLKFARSFGMDDWAFGEDHAESLLKKQFQVNSLQAYGLDGSHEGLQAAGACLQYLQDSRHSSLPHISTIQKIEQNDFLYMDRFTQRNLELIHKNHENSKTLFEVLNFAITPMGARLLKNWLIFPLIDQKTIDERLDLVQFFLDNITWTKSLVSLFGEIGDLERLVSRIALCKANPREYWTLYRSIRSVNEVRKLLENLGPLLPGTLKDKLLKLENLEALIRETLMEQAPAVLAKGNVIAQGIHAELDELRAIAFGGKDYLVQLQQKEAERSGINSLKLSFNSVFGYYFEVTHIHRDKVPEDWIRKQTLVNAERYISAELKVYEEKIIGAEDKILQLETQLFSEFQEKVLHFLNPLTHNCKWISYMDLLTNFAFLAQQKNYSRPHFHAGNALRIKEGRHPVIEESLEEGQKFIPNDLWVNPENQQILMITGPNMSGKSAILRQSALLVIMAQMGSFVPSQKLELGIVDKIFTRVGASDNLSAGQSTFMVEMIETASILNNLSDRSLILLDEIGRGTSTYDGISIAWSIAEFLHDHPQYKPKTLFATHYHELNEMESFFPRIKNYSIAIKESGDRILFLRKLIEGGSEHSFGIHVAKMAGIPTRIISRAQDLLAQLEKGESPWALKMENAENQTIKIVSEAPYLFYSEIQKEIAEINLDHITPLEAMMILSGLKKRILGEPGENTK